MAVIVSKEEQLGIVHRQMGYSVYYNPFRNKGTSKQFTDWLAGYRSL